MTRKHFQAIADALKTSQAPIEVVKAVMAACKSQADQPEAFQKDKFLKACGF